MSETRMYAAQAVVVGLAIIAAMAVMPGFVATNNAVAQSGNETSTTTGNETSTTTNPSTTPSTPGNNETSTTGASITLTPASGAPGSNVTIAGTGFLPGQTFKFTFDDGYLLSGNMIQDTFGNFNTTVLVPANTTSGDHQVAVAGSAGENATATFSVGEGAREGSAGNATSTGNSTTTMTTPSGGNETAVPSETGNSTTIAPPSSGNTTTPLMPESP
ncbi:hypothetical protein NTE_00716 [Candidatus Nitrososphaera evergladensis SR1]|uniref:IPT/TIG domain-containing protein n=1 Tax=Candidatus Nitrososphaera evergladensis SR1 TaxID=1459636 RepID=A0A075MMX3_9ARCH|nr:hypothetical protein [Candidatus Nitrososphaera evergladensis]AIF82796.1 hypothetical protein NTE_00716 [Candidatus Nitrososphaera evergladensis SR1]